MRLPMEYDIGFRPETNQASWGIPQTSAFGALLRGRSTPFPGALYLPYEPYLERNQNFLGRQLVASGVPEFLYGEYLGYRGILPLALQSIPQIPYPYQLSYPYNRMA